MIPNSSESPDGSRKLAAVLAEIAEIEEAPDYMGQKINRDIKEARWVFGTAEEEIEYEDEYGHRARISIPDEWLVDIVVGAIGRACETRGWRLGFSAFCWSDGYRAFIRAQGVGEVIISCGRDESRALAAAHAYRDAIKETTK